MSDEKFTKGNWWVIAADPYVGVQMSLDGGFRIMTSDREVAVANAHLITCAPEMYHALNAIVKLGLGDDCKINIDSLKQLLSKARGEL